MDRLLGNIVDVFILGGWASVVAILILIISFLLYFFWYAAYQRPLLRSLRSLSFKLEDKAQDIFEIELTKSENKKVNEVLVAAWSESKNRIIQIKNDKIVMYGTPIDIWNARHLISKRFNFSLAESIPNILVGVGLFFTFLFLTLALTEATNALTAASSSQDTENAIRDLLTIAGSKFITSLCALFASIIWTIFLKRSLNKVDMECTKIIFLLSNQVSVNADEVVTQQQLATSNDELEQSEMQTVFLEELLEDSREQTGTFKRFETDLAVSLAGAINNVFSPQMEMMTQQLVGAITNLSDRLGTMNQDALKKMLDDFAAMLHKSTADEMERLQQSLSDLTQSLHGAGTSFETQSNQAAMALTAAGTSIENNLKEVGEILAQQTQSMSLVMTQGKESLQNAVSQLILGFDELQALVDYAASKGKEGASNSQKLLESLEKTVTDLNDVGLKIIKVSNDFNTTRSEIGLVVDRIQELAREQQSVVLAVKETAPNALQAVEKVSDVLELAAQQSLKNMEYTREAMDATAVSLGNTVATITEGVSVYSQQVADLHKNMDGQLAKAVGGFDHGLKELMEIVDELTEVLQKNKV